MSADQTTILGQILPDSNFGRVLTELARQSEVIVETGTWHGEGSTRCIANGLIRTTQKFYSLEKDCSVHAEAFVRYIVDPRVVLLCGSAVPTYDHGEKQVITDLPEHIDLLLIDSADEDGRNEFLKLEPRVRKWIALDDTREVKNRENRADLISRGWKMIHDHLDERNGWAVFERP